MDDPLSVRAYRVLPFLLVASGRLQATDREVRFTPHWTERIVGRDTWSVDTGQVVEVTVLPRRLRAVMSGGLARRVQLTLADGRIERFVVWPRPERTAEALRELATSLHPRPMVPVASAS